MKLKNLTIGSQLTIGFSVIIFSITLLGYVAYNQGVMLHSQTETLFNHPLVVRRAIADVEINILKMRLATRDLMLASTEAEKSEAIMTVEKSFLEADRNFKIIYDRYLGSKQDVDEAHDAFLIWNNARQKNLQLSVDGKIGEVKKSLSKTGEVGVLREDMLNKIHKISEFARNKSISLNQNSNKISTDLLLQLLLICLFLTLFAVVVSYFLISNIRKPLKELLHVVLDYRSGNLLARSKNTSSNEIGTLAVAFNEMLDHLKIESDLALKSNRISNAMLVEDNAHRFFKELLPVLAAETNSQVATVYLLDENKNEYRLYESVGLTLSSANQRFSSTNLEGEFGYAMVSKEICFIKRIPKETAFTFNTVSGNLVPREIVTIPILVGNAEVVAFISLASIRSYPTETIKLIYKIFDVLTARVDGILAYRAIRKASAKLVEQNIELETQRNELNQQSTELIQQNAELEIQKNQLKEVSRLKTTFLSNMSHELRTPLNSVIALSGVLNRRLVGKIPEDEFSYIGVIERNGKHLLSLINDILDISRIEAGREEVEINAFEVDDVISEVIEMIQPQANERKIQLSQLRSDKRINIFTDKQKVRHILQNLIANAVKFTEVGKVEVTVNSNDSTVRIQVKDTGIGISEENLKHIFEEFRQADGSTSRRFGGTGLGLAIARKYARLLGGEIEVESQLKVGSVFTLILPLKQVIKQPVVESDKAFDSYTEISINTGPQLTGKHILLIEDSEPAVIQIKDMLESNNYSVTSVSSGVAALEILKTFTPDAMILDLMMPQMDGFELLENIRNFEKTKDVPVLILTAKHITKEDIKQLKSNNIHQLIQKGDVKKDELLQSVYSMVVASDAKKNTVESNNSEKSKLLKDKKPLILIVEDNLDNMTTVKAVLGDKYEIIEANDGKKGIEMAKSHVPDLILMDIALPEMDGIQAFKAIRGDAYLNRIPVVALTASAMTTEREAILAYGFDGYIPKPIEEINFFETLNQVLYGK